MTKYKCNRCRFETQNKKNLVLHKKTLKHISLHPEEKVTSVDPDLICMYCCNTFSRKSSRTRHEKNCKKKNISLETAKLGCPYCTKKFGTKGNLMRHLKKTCSKYKIKMMEQEMDKQSQMVDFQSNCIKVMSGINNKTNMKNMNYINKTYTSALPLQKITYKKFVNKNKIKCIDGKIYNEQIVQELIHSFNNDIIDRYVGDIITGIYKDPDPESRSIWCSDVSRLKFIIRILNELGEEKWITDNKGLKTCEYIINPLITKFEKLLETYDKKYCIAKKGKIYTYEEKSIMLNNNLAILGIFRMIKSRKLHKKILKYIAPHFTTSKDVKIPEKIV